jgi:hypothetical protein
VNVTELFPAKKRTNDGWDENGRRTAYWLRQQGVWKEMVADIWGCENQHQLFKCRLVWSLKVTEDKWPDYHIELANQEFDAAVEALAALQAE